MTAIRVPNGWAPRTYQRPLWNYLKTGGLRADVAAHRRWGKDDIALNWGAVSCMRRPGNYWHMLPEAAQARKAVWDAINPHSGRRRIDETFPQEIRETTREQDMLIRFKNGATWQVLGSDNYDSFVGSPPIGIVFSEWSLAKPEAWTYTRPILVENGGWALFIWTPRGRNHATRAFESRETDPTWFTQRSTAKDTGVFSQAQLIKERADMIAEAGSEEEGDAKFRQEYFVDFDVAVPGSYFGTLVSTARAEGRIQSVGYDPAIPVDTAWDLGVDDYTAIWFFQRNGARVHAIDYYEASGEGAPGIVADALNAKPWRWGQHFLPHDVMVREWGGGARTRLETLRGLGVNPIRVGVAANPADRINASRRLLPFVWFDSQPCSVGLDRLRNYRKNWNRSLGAYTGPVHDENSHGCDAFGEFAINCQIVPLRLPVASSRETDLWGRPASVEGDWRVA